MTGDYSEDTPSLLTESLGHIARATLVLPDTEVLELDLVAGSVSFDDTRAPRVTANLTCRVPTDQAILDRMDPRQEVRVLVYTGYMRPGQIEDVHLLADLGMRDRQVSRPGDRLLIEAASDEALIIDNSPSAGGTITTATTTDAITDILQLVLPTVAPTVEGPTGPAVALTPLEDKWDAVADLADRIEAQVYDDGTRTWHIAPRANTIGDPVHTLAVGEGGTVTDSDSGLSRDGWFNRVFLAYEWQQTRDITHRAGTTVQAGITTLAASAAERLVPGVDVQIPTASDQSDPVIHVFARGSMSHAGTAKQVTWRLRRTDELGTVLASAVKNATVDSVGGADAGLTWDTVYTDTAPTDGRYVLTAQATGASTSAIYIAPWRRLDAETVIPSEGYRQRIVSVRSITSGPYAATAGNVRTYQEDRQVPTTQAGADAAATALVKRTVTRGRALQLGAISAYWIRPGDTITSSLPLGDPEPALVSGVSFDLRAGSMNVTTRLPDNTGTIGA